MTLEEAVAKLNEHRHRMRGNWTKHWDGSAISLSIIAQTFIEVKPLEVAQGLIEWEQSQQKSDGQ